MGLLTHIRDSIGILQRTNNNHKKCLFCGQKKFLTGSSLNKNKWNDSHKIYAVHTEIVGLHQDLKNVWWKTEETHEDKLPIDELFQIKESPLRLITPGLSLEPVTDIPDRTRTAAPCVRSGRLCSILSPMPRFWDWWSPSFVVATSSCFASKSTSWGLILPLWFCFSP